MPLDAPTLHHALAGLQPRQARLLVRRCVDGQPREALAADWGTSPAALDLLLLRAALAFEAALAGRPEPRPLPVAQERPLGDALRDALEAGRSDAGPAQALAALTAHREAVRTAIARAEAAADAGPRRARETRLRWLAIVVVLAVAAWFSRQQVRAAWRDVQQRLGWPAPGSGR